MKTGIFIWQFDKDYPPALPSDDTALPMAHAFVKTNDGLAWMKQFDSHPAAIGGFADVTRVVTEYGKQQIGCVPWGVIHGGQNAKAEGLLAGAIASRAGGLYMVDLEPYPGFWTGGDDEVDEFMVAFLNNGGREIWLCPDTRNAALEPIRFRRWLDYSQVTRIWPQAYWTDFETDWLTGLQLSLDPLGTLPRSRIWPCLPANGATADNLAAIAWLERQSYPGFAVWRRGTLTPQMIAVLNSRTAFDAQPPEPAPKPDPATAPPEVAAPDLTAIVNATAEGRKQAYDEMRVFLRYKP